MSPANAYLCQQRHQSESCCGPHERVPSLVGIQRQFQDAVDDTNGDKRRRCERSEQNLATVSIFRYSVCRMEIGLLCCNCRRVAQLLARILPLSQASKRVLRNRCNQPMPNGGQAWAVSFQDFHQRRGVPQVEPIKSVHVDSSGKCTRSSCHCSEDCA
jgi:hypothetical protein